MLVRRWLDMAGIVEPVLRECYTICARRLSARNDAFPQLMVRALAADRRAYLIAFLEAMSEADDLADTGPPEGRRQRLQDWYGSLRVAVECGHSNDPVLHAAAHAIRSVWDTPPWESLDEFYGALRRDSEFTEFATYEQLREWAVVTCGVSGVLLIVVGALPLGEGFEGITHEWGELFQLADNLSDLSEDLRDGRLFLPLEDLDRFGVDRADLEAGRWTEGVAELIAFELARITDRIPGLMARSLQHPGAAVYCQWFATLLRLWCDAARDAGPALLRRKAMAPIGAQLSSMPELWRSAIPC